MLVTPRLGVPFSFHLRNTHRQVQKDYESLFDGNLTRIPCACIKLFISFLDAQKLELASSAKKTNTSLLK